MSKRDQRGENNPNWKGSNIGIDALHYRVQVKFGKPKQCSHCGTVDPEKVYNWANISGEYLGVDDFMRLCRSCHMKYDNVIRNIPQKPRTGKTLKCSNCNTSRYYYPSALTRVGLKTYICKICRIKNATSTETPAKIEATEAFKKDWESRVSAAKRPPKKAKK